MDGKTVMDWIGVAAFFGWMIAALWFAGTTHDRLKNLEDAVRRLERDR